MPRGRGSLNSRIGRRAVNRGEEQQPAPSPLLAGASVPISDAALHKPSSSEELTPAPFVLDTSTVPAPTSLAARESQLDEQHTEKEKGQKEREPNEEQKRYRDKRDRKGGKKSKSAKSSSFEKRKEMSLPPHLLVSSVEVVTEPSPVPATPWSQMPAAQRDYLHDTGGSVTVWPSASSATTSQRFDHRVSFGQHTPSQRERTAASSNHQAGSTLRTSQSDPPRPVLLPPLPPHLQQSGITCPRFYPALVASSSSRSFHTQETDTNKRQRTLETSSTSLQVPHLHAPRSHPSFSEEPEVPSNPDSPDLPKYLDLTCPQALLGYDNHRINQSILFPPRLYPGHTQLYLNTLTRWFPSPLKECFLVASAREATALALGMAKACSHSTGLLTVLGGPCCPDKAEPDSSSQSSSPIRCIMPHKIPSRISPQMQFKIDAKKLAVSPFGLSALIVECMITSECLNYPSGFLEEAFGIVRSLKGLCIVDESQTGLGRSGFHFWYFQKLNIMPDIVIVGEALGNGFPLAAVITTKEIAAASQTVLQEFLNPFAGNLASTIGLEVLLTLQGGLVRNVAPMGALLLNKLKCLAESSDFIASVRGCGLFCGLEICEFMDPDRPAPAMAEQIQSKLRAQKILVSVEGREKNIITLKPPFSITMEDINIIYNAFIAILPAFSLSRPSAKYSLRPSNLQFFREHLAYWGIKIDSINEISQLDSHDDTIFRVIVTSDSSDLLDFIFKIDNLHTTYAHIHLQHHAMERISAANVPCSVHMPLLSDPSRFCLRLPSGHYCRLLKYLPGSLFSDLAQPDDRFYQLGTLAGRVAAALATLKMHPAAKRPSRWNLMNSINVIRRHAAFVEDRSDSSLLDRLVDTHGLSLDSHHLRCQIIHGNINHRNVIVLPNSNRFGINGFADVSYSFLAAELATTCAYALLARLGQHPGSVILPIIQNFHRQCPLAQEELACLWSLIALRLAVFVSISAHTRSITKGREPGSCSEQPAWTILRQYGSPPESDEISKRISESICLLDPLPVTPSESLNSSPESR